MMATIIGINNLGYIILTVISMGSSTMTIDPDGDVTTNTNDNNDINGNNVLLLNKREIKLIHGTFGHSKRSIEDNNCNNCNNCNNTNNNNNGLEFIHEPPNRVTFFNTEGMIVECSANSSFSPVKITWATMEGETLFDVTGLRYIRDDGLLVFPPFNPTDYKQSIHSARYVCIATDKYGSIASRLVTVKAVIRRSLTIHVHDQHALPGGTTAFTCHISGSESSNQLMEVTSWLEEPSGRVITTTSSKLLTIGTLLSSKYISLDDGRLYITSISSSLNNNRYRCRVTCKLTGEVLTSSSAGRLIVAVHREPFAPQITVKSDLIIGEVASQVVVTCLASGYPLPSYKWIPRYSMIKQHQHQQQHLMTLMTGNGDNSYYNNNNTKYAVPYPSVSYPDAVKDSNVGENDERYIQVNQFLVIRNVNQGDMGTIGCWTNNSLGHDKASIQLMVHSPLRVNFSIISDFERDSQVTLINCDYSGYPVTSIEWRLNGHPLSSLYSLNGSSIVKLLSPTRLKIESVSQREEGYYQCFISNEYESAHGIVQLRKPVIALRFLETFNSVILSEGDSVQLLCKVEGYPPPRITWTLDSQPISSSIHKRDIITETDSKENIVVSLLKLHSIILLDGGLYGCVAENSGKKIVHSRRVAVRGLPFVKSLADRITIAGSQLTVRCPVVGYPIDRLIWTKDGQSLPYNSNQEVNSDGMLEIRNQSKAHDQGKYKCRAFQGNYSSESSFSLSIQVKPIIETFRFPGGLHEGQRASISCTVATGDYPMTITWTKDGSIISNDSSSPKVISVSDYSSSLLFESLDVTHRGNYTCRATNDAGFTEHSAYLEINEAPLWTLEPIDSWSIRGNKVIIHCQATGYPIPRIRWSRSFDSSGKEFKPIASNPHMQVHENGSLIIHETVSSDAGYYLCQAHNSVGPGLSKVVNLNVYVKAHFKHHKFHNHSRIDGNSTLTCIAYGDDPLDIQWFKDDQTITWNYVGTSNHQHHSYGLHGFSHYQLFEEHLPNLVSSELHIISSKRSDNGLFKCRSSNSFGTDELIINITVQEAPSQPTDLFINKISSRWIALSWKTEFDGHSPITNHLIKYIEYSSPSSETMPLDQNKVTVVMGDSMNSKVTGLHPGQRYSFSVIAENSLGRSNSSFPILATTDEEPPSTPPVNLSLNPLSSSSIRVTWDPPEFKGRNGVILGYYIGIRPVNEIGTAYTYHTFNVSNEKDLDKNELENSISHDKSKSSALSPIHQRLSIILDNLKQLTKYSIIVHSFNSKGSSPASPEKQATTFGIDLPSTPNPSIVYISSTSIHLTWTQIIDDSHPIQGYHIYHRTSSFTTSNSPNRYSSIETDNWSQITLIGHQTFYTFQGLDCGTLYSFYLVAYNSMGLSPPSDIIQAKTNGSLPVIPDYSEAIYQNASSCIYISLEAWRSSGCPVEDFSIRYQINTGLISRWHQLNIPDEVKWKGLVTIDNVIESIDKIQISVRNKLGITKVEYIFSPSSSTYSSSDSSSAPFSVSSSHSHSLSRASKSSLNFNSTNLFRKQSSPSKVISKSTNNGFESTLLSQVIYYAAWGSVLWLIALLIYFATKSKIWSNCNYINSSSQQSNKSTKQSNPIPIVFDNNSTNLLPRTLPLTNTNDDQMLEQTSNCMTMKIQDKCSPPETLVTMVKMTGNGASYEPLYSTIMKKPQCKL